MIPFWLLAIIPALDHCRPTFRGRTFCLLLLAVSVFSAWYPLSGPWRQPWLFNLMQQAGWIDYSNPPPQLGPRFHTWIRQLPPAPDDQDAPSEYWIVFEGIGSDGHIDRLRLEHVTGSDINRPELTNRDVRLIRIKKSVVVEQGREVDSQEWLIAVDPQAFSENRTADQMVVWSDPMSDPDQTDVLTDVLTIVRGLPEPVDPSKPPFYRPRRIRYLDGPFKDRKEKFQCVQATGQVLSENSGRLPPTVYRRDLWITDDVPFGVLMFETNIQDAHSRETLSRQRMHAVDASHVIPFKSSRLRRGV